MREQKYIKGSDHVNWMHENQTRLAVEENEREANQEQVGLYNYADCVWGDGVRVVLADEKKRRGMRIQL